MNSQDVNSELRNSSSAPMRSNDGNRMQDQTRDVTVNEAKADLQGERKIDSTSYHFAGTGPNFSGMILPLNTSVQGIFSSLAIKSLQICVLFVLLVILLVL